MTIANLDMEALQKKIIEAYQADSHLLEKFREYARRLKDNVRPLKAYSVNAVSFVSADGGDNRIMFDPALIELVRVVDSRGQEYVLDVVASSSTLDELEKRIQPGPQCIEPLRRLCSDLGLKLGELSYLLKNMGQGGNSTSALRAYRDIVEWAVLYEMVCNPHLQWGGDTILVRDGLLRTKTFRRDIFPKIREKIKAGIEVHARRNVTVSLVGVAKQSAVLSKLAVALELEGVFHRKYPCYVEVPLDIERDCYNYDRTWLLNYDTAETEEERARFQSMGCLHLVKFGDKPGDPVWPVDIADWQRDQAPKILGQLIYDAQYGFPIPDYPMCIQKAHDRSRIGHIEIEILQDMVFKGLTQNLNADEYNRLLRFRYLSQDLKKWRYMEG
ncbi:hypothetical protein [Moorella sp. E306M]|uniref:hypothetical protein n=1 Tax=Moorella sp. E306M TaxID=2572683 RepID=UPI0010FFC693|nr:hypothetical protein [Moorella sp. E306M]GEA18914.1 hypothetical protein E306M_20510 [Moorella sp. E306M]